MRLSVHLLSLACAGLLAATPATAQVGYGGYPSAASMGAYGGIGHRAGGYAPGGYYIGNGQLGSGYAGANRLNQRAYASVNPGQTAIVLQPLYDAITSLPSWSGKGGDSALHKRQPAHPKVPTHDLLSADGQILWPAGTPAGSPVADARNAAEDTVRRAVREHAKDGHATVRQVVDAKNKLLAFERPALKELRARNPADAARLEKFCFELGKTLETMAVNY